MKKVAFYSVSIVESLDSQEVSSRASYFTSFREARSYYRTCLAFYDGLQHNNTMGHVDIKLFKTFYSYDKEDEKDLIDSFSKNYWVYLHTDSFK